MGHPIGADEPFMHLSTALLIFPLPLSFEGENGQSNGAEVPCILFTKSSMILRHPLSFTGCASLTCSGCALLRRRRLRRCLRVFSGSKICSSDLIGEPLVLALCPSSKVSRVMISLLLFGEARTASVDSPCLELLREPISIRSFPRLLWLLYWLT